MKKSDKAPPRHFPDTVGEDVANRINYALVMQDWIDSKTADDLEEIAELAGSLETNAGDERLWRKLFEKVDEL